MIKHPCTIQDLISGQVYTGVAEVSEDPNFKWVRFLAEMPARILLFHEEDQTVETDID